MRFLCCLLLSCLGTNLLLGQESEKLSEELVFSSDFEFNEGFYIVYQDFKNNRPLPFDSVYGSADLANADLIKKVLSEDEMVYSYDGKEIKVPTSRIWGYSSNGNVYMQIQNRFNRVLTIGRICHVVASITTMTPVYTNGMNSFGMPVGMGVSRVPTTEIKQVIFDFRTGQTMDFNPDNLLLLLKENIALKDEFAGYSEKKRKEKLHSFMVRFNEANPLYFPE